MDNLKEQKCLLCGGDTKLMTTKQKGYVEPVTYSIYNCLCCNTSFSMPRVDTSSVYEMIYQNGKKIDGYNRYWEYAEEIVKQKDAFMWLANTEPAYWGPYDVIMKQLKLEKNAKILEIGSGLGYFTYALRSAGFYQAIGWDISPEAVKKANERFGNYYEVKDANKVIDNYEGRFDIIVLTEVLEHIEEPKVLLDSISKILTPKGRIVLTTPNKSFYPDNSIWITDLPPVHCWWFSEDSFRYLAKQMNFEIQFIDYTSYYKTHEKYLYNTNYSTNLNGDYVFNNKGEYIDRTNLLVENKKNEGFLPLWIKKTNLYKKISRKYWPLFCKHIIAPGKRTDIQCVIMSKRTL